MNGTNIAGSIVVTLILLCLVGYAVYRGADAEWTLFFKVIGTLGAVGLLASLITSLGGKKA